MDVYNSVGVLTIINAKVMITHRRKTNVGLVISCGCRIVPVQPTGPIRFSFYKVKKIMLLFPSKFGALGF